MQRIPFLSLALILIFGVPSTGLAGAPPDLSAEIPVWTADRTLPISPVNAMYEDGPDGGLVVYQNSWQDTSLWATRVDAEGQPLDPFGFRIQSQPRDAWLGAVSRLADRYLVVWAEQGPQLMGRVLLTDGTFLGEPFPIAEGPVDAAAATAVGDRFLVVWNVPPSVEQPGDFGLFGAFVSVAGSVGDRIDLGEGRSGMSLTSAGDGALMASVITSWPRQRRRLVGRGFQGWHHPTYSVEVSRISSEGEIVEGSILEAEMDFQNSSPPRTDIARQNGSFIVAWDTPREIHLRDVDPAGRPIGSLVVFESPKYDGRPRAPLVAGDDGRAIVAWNSDWDYAMPGRAVLRDVTGTFGAPFAVPGAVVGLGGRDETFVLFSARTEPLRSRILSVDGVLGEAVDLALTVPSQTSPAVAASLTEFLVGWIERPGVGSPVLARRFSFEGEPLDEEPIRIGELNAAGEFGGDLAVVSNGSEYLVIWEEGWWVRVRRVATSGIVLDSEPLQICTRCRADDAVWMGSRYAIAVEDPMGPEWVATIEPAPSTTVEILVNLGTRGGEIDLAWSGSSLMVSQHRQHPPCSPCGPWKVVALRFAADGSPLDAEPWVVTERVGLLAGSLASSGGAGNVGVVTLTQRIWFTLVGEDGAVLPTMDISPDDDLVVPEPDLAWTGKSFVVVYPAREGDIGGIRVLASGQPLEDAGSHFPIAISDATETAPAVAAGPFGLAIVAYEKRPSGTGGTDVVFRIISD